MSNWNFNTYLDFEKTMLGQIIERIAVSDNVILFTMIYGKVYEMSHDQDCCEEVIIADICGDLNDLIGERISQAEIVTNRENPPEGARFKLLQDQDGSFTWTFYKLGTSKGTVTLRWYGQSSGYYSEEVDFILLSQDYNTDNWKIYEKIDRK